MSDNPILDGIVYDKSTGSLLYKDVRYILIRPETIAGFQRAIAESCGQEADEKLFAGGLKGGSLSSKKFKELHNLSDQELIGFMMHMGNHIGWGCFNLEHVDSKEKILHISVQHSPFAELYGKSSTGVCHLIRGVFAGMASVIFETYCIAEETECIAKGNQRCLFVIKGN